VIKGSLRPSRLLWLVEQVVCLSGHASLAGKSPHWNCHFPLFLEFLAWEKKMSLPFALSNTHQVQLQQVIKQQLIQTSSFDDDVLPVCWFFLAASGF